MPSDPEFAFGPFRLDPPNARLTRGRQAVPLKPKAFDVLLPLSYAHQGGAGSVTSRSLPLPPFPLPTLILPVRQTTARSSGQME